jgi:ParB family chromosome partitioning protein
MADTHLANHRGTITGLAASGPRALYVSRHAEDQATALYVFDFDANKASQSALPASATALKLVDKTAYVACTDGTVYTVLPGKKPKVFADADNVAAIEPVAGGIALAAGSSVAIHDTSGTEIAAWNLGEPVSALAASPDGTWLTAGTRRGTLAVFTHADDAWTDAQRDRLHDGEVTALKFAPDELRVYSAGSDSRILISYVRGSFDTEDRSKGNSHDRPIRDLVVGPEFSTDDGKKRRFYTVSDDSTVKSWPLGRGGSQRPSTLNDGVVQSTHAAIVTVDDAPHLVVAGTDSTLRLFSFDAEGKAEARVATVNDGYAHAEALLGDSAAKTRQKGFEALADFADARAVGLHAEYALEYEADHKLRVKATKMLAAVDHKDVGAALERFFDADASDVRVAALDGLLTLRGNDHRDTLELAIDSGYEDLGLRAVAAAHESGSDAARDLLRTALDNANENVRIAALTALEKLHGDDPGGTLLGLDSGHESMRRRALVRLYERKALDTPKVAARIRRTWDDPEYRVRHTAFHVATLRRPTLVAHLRAGDPQYHRQIFELDHFGKAEKDRPKDVPAAKAPRGKLTEDDLFPVLEAAAARDLEVSLLGARALAVVGDERALGTLLQLSREGQSHARANAAIALQALGDPRAIKRIRMMLHDGEQQVRDAAFSALDQLQTDDPLATVSAGLQAPHVDTRERALSLLATTLKAAKGKPEGDFAGRDLLLRALNDSDKSVRLEAFKNALNLEVEGGGPDTLRFIAQSHQADVRRRCLEEAQAYPKEAAYKDFLLELVDDPDFAIATAAYDFAHKRWPSAEHARLYEAMVTAELMRTRTFGIDKLAGEREAKLRALLAKPLADKTPEVRLAAVAALVRADMRDVLTSALESPFEDVRVESASALASLGDERALDGLLAIVNDYRERLVQGASDDELADREDRVVSALGGIRDLGHARALSTVVELIEVEKAAVVL